MDIAHPTPTLLEVRLEPERHVACVAVAVDYRIPATDAMSCSMPAKKATFDEVQRVAMALKEHTAILAATLRREGIR